MAGLVFALASVGLSLMHRDPPLPVPAPVAIPLARANPELRSTLGAGRVDRVTVGRVDARFDRVSFFLHGRIEAEVEVDRSGSAQGVDFRRLPVPYGSFIAYGPVLLAGLAAIFTLMTAVVPWRRLRNLDVAALLSLLVPVWLLQGRYVQASVLASLPPLLYLLVRCAWQGLRESGPPAPAATLWSLATAGLLPQTRVRILRLVALGLALALAMITVTSNDAVDVIYAVMEGATNLVHGMLPYGHMPGDVVHGDTYPILSYALYVPLALVSPVASRWDTVDPALAVAAIAAIATAFALAVAQIPGGFRGRRRGKDASGLEPALVAAIAWLAFPPLMITASTGTTDVMLGALLVLALLLWRRPAVCAALITAAAWFKLAPAALLALVFAPLRGKTRVAPAVAIVAVSAPLVGLLLALGGTGAVPAMAHAVAFQLSRGSDQSLWAAAHLQAWQPIGQAVVLALLAGIAMRLRMTPALAADRRRIAGLLAAVLIGLQLTANYWAFLYVVWFVPLVVVSLLSPARQVEPATAAVPATRPGALADAAPA